MSSPCTWRCTWKMAHADRREILRWLRGFRRPPGRTYVVHAEGRAADVLADSIHRELGWSVAVARDGETVAVGGSVD